MPKRRNCATLKKKDIHPGQQKPNAPIMKTLPVSSKAAIQFVFPPAPSRQTPGPLHCLCALELGAELCCGGVVGN